MNGPSFTDRFKSVSDITRNLMTGKLNKGISDLLQLRRQDKFRKNYRNRGANDPNLAGYICANCGGVMEEQDYGKHPISDNQFLCDKCFNKVAPAVATASSDAPKVIRVVLEPQDLHPEFLQTFMDETGLLDGDSLGEFIDSLSPEECSIMKEHKNRPHILRQLKEMILSDFDESAKDLEMEG